MDQIIEKINNCQDSASRINLIKEYVKNGFNINSVDKNGNTMLMHACILKDNELVKFLLDNNASRGIENRVGVRPTKYVREQIRSAKRKIASRQEYGDDFNELNDLRKEVNAFEEIFNSLNYCEQLER